MPDFPTNPYKGQIFYDPDSDTIYEYLMFPERMIIFVKS